MFGFGNNPPNDIYEELARTAHNMAQLMSYIQVKKTLVPRTRQETPIDLTDRASREQIIECFETLVSEHALLDLRAIERRDILNDLALKMSQDKDTPQIYENTATVLVAMNWIDFCFRTYYEDYPKSKKLLELTNQLTKLAIPAIELVFCDGYPENYRRMWPYLSSVMEQYREAYS
jgi:hypothetical protein|tara:strand:- start:109 stop:636 length:528 start_codon:yes stop_codon:yes gene_type:complete